MMKMQRCKERQTKGDFDCLFYDEVVRLLEIQDFLSCFFRRLALLLVHLGIGTIEGLPVGACSAVVLHPAAVHLYSHKEFVLLGSCCVH